MAKHEEVKNGVIFPAGEKNPFFYTPWGNLAIFYRDFGFANGLIKLGRIESGTEKLAMKGNFTVKIEKID